MVLIAHELRQNRRIMIIWTGVLAIFLAVCMFIFPEMKTQMQGMSDLFSAMGMFTAAFGMDKLDFGTLTGFYAIECGSIIGLGGSFFAALMAVNALAKEEKDHTAEFLYAHPIKRKEAVLQKLAAVLIQILILNIVVFLVGILSIAAVGETVPWKDLSLLHTAYLFVQLELAGICFGISAFIRSNGFGIGIGIAISFYFMNLIANISDKMKVLKYISPFGYADGADIVSKGSLDMLLIACGLAVSLICCIAAVIWYDRKDFRC